MQKAIVKVGRNRVEVEVIAQTESGYQVRSLKSGREFTIAKLEAPAQRLALLEAAIRALQAQPPGTALNTRELVELATASGLWANNGAKTPEQTLYSAIFREIATKERPRIIRSAERGKFELNRKG
ncbi:HTH domain-containing protein [Victivallis lenta]|nr:HTH domain-containing protein [Victivallis lenta]